MNVYGYVGSLDSLNCNHMGRHADLKSNCQASFSVKEAEPLVAEKQLLCSSETPLTCGLQRFSATSVCTAPKPKTNITPPTSN